jgi:Ca-activated chloride channel homolog
VPVMDQAQLVYMLVEAGASPAYHSHRLPLNFALVLDQSGSMAGQKLHTMKAAVKHLIDQLDKDDIITIIAFESNAHVLVSAQPASDKEALKRQVDKLKDGGGTRMAPALQEALRLVGQKQGEERVNRIVLLTDGEATDPLYDSRQAADEAGVRGIPLIALGLGQEWKEEFLFDLADRSILAPPGSRTGLADYIPEPQDVERIFQEVYQSMQILVQDLALTVRLVQGVEARRVWQVMPMIRDMSPTAIQGRAVVISDGHLDRSGIAYLVELMLPPRPAGLVRVAQVEVIGMASDENRVRAAADVLIEFSADATRYDHQNEHVMEVVEKIQAFKLQTQALSDAQNGDVENATRKLRQAVTILLAQGDIELAGMMEKEVNRLEQSGTISNAGKKTIMLTSRKTVRLTE